MAQASASVYPEELLEIVHIISTMTKQLLRVMAMELDSIKESLAVTLADGKSFTRLNLVNGLCKVLASDFEQMFGLFTSTETDKKQKLQKYVQEHVIEIVEFIKLFSQSWVALFQATARE